MGTYVGVRDTDLFGMRHDHCVWMEGVILKIVDPPDLVVRLVGNVQSARVVNWIVMLLIRAMKRRSVMKRRMEGVMENHVVKEWYALLLPIRLPSTQQ